jgi:chemotaxis protein MotA
MDISIIISIILAFASLLAAFVLEGGHLGSLLQPTAALIVFGGTFGAVGVSFSGAVLAKIPKIIVIVFKKYKHDRREIIDIFYKVSNLARGSGLLSLEAELQDSEYDPFIKQGLQLVMDGTDPEVIRKLLENKLDNLEHRHSKGIGIFESAGGFAPTMGVLGTVMGLVHVLGNLSNPETLGPQIAVAFIATLYGVGCLPKNGSR